MATRRRGSGPGPTTPETFGSDGEARTKLDWFCYRLSTDMYNHTKEGPGRQLRQRRVRDETLADLSVHFAIIVGRELSRRPSGGPARVQLSYRTVERFLPKVGARLTDRVLDAARQALRERLIACARCPVGCGLDLRGRITSAEEATCREARGPGHQCR